MRFRKSAHHPLIQRKILDSLGHLRIEEARIKPLDSAAARGGKAVVEAAILTPAEQTNSRESNDTEYIAVKKMRFDMETDGDRSLGVSFHWCSVSSSGQSETEAYGLLKAIRP